MMNDDVASLLLQLESADRQGRQAAARALGSLRARKAVPALIQALDDKYTKVRLAAMEALARIGDERAIPPLIRMAGVKAFKVRSTAGIMLGSMGPRAVPYLLKALEDERANVREQAVKALGRIGDGRAFSSLLQMLDDKSLRVRIEVTKALEQLGDKRAVPHLGWAVKRKTKSSRYAAMAIGRLGGVAELGKLLEDGRAWVRLSATVGLRFAGQAGTPHLVRVLDDPRQEVRLEAARTLAQRGDERAVPALLALLDAPSLPRGARRQIESYLKQLGADVPSPEPQLDEVWSQAFQRPEAEAVADGQTPQRVADLRLHSLLPGRTSMTWIDDLLERDANVLLTPTWIAQAQKASSQKMLMETERDTLWPMARELMGDLWYTLSDERARKWAGTALALLNDVKGTGAIAERVQRVLQDPASTPRGHYEEGMHGYFRGMQFLLKSVFDVRLDRDWCQYMAHYVFPWSALPPIVRALKDNAKLRRRWEDLHRFYTVFTGTPDAVCICHLLVQDEVTQATVERLARQMAVPKINQKVGLGVQGLGERFTLHSQVFEHLTKTFLPTVSALPIPRESVYAVVNMRSLLYGFAHLDGRVPMLQGGQVDGLLAALAPLRRKRLSSFFDQFLLAQYELVADLPAPGVTALAPGVDPAVAQLSPATRRRLNSFAANLTSLLELSILSAKQSVYNVMIGAIVRPRCKVYVEEAPPGFFQRLQRAGQTVVDLCRDMRKRYGVHPQEKRPDDARSLMSEFEVDHEPPTRLGPIYDILGDLAQGGRYILKPSTEWSTISPLVERPARSPNVTADVYRHLHGGTQYFLQWCTAMAAFEAQMTDGTPVEGAELLFVEGWNDVIVPGRREPLTNSAWRKVLNAAKLADLGDWTIAPMST
jgi:HEAT repeat protein